MAYAEIPVLLRFEASASGGVKPFFYAGPAVGFRANCEAEGKDNGISVKVDCDDFDTGFKTIDYSVIIGGGLAFDVSGKTFSLGARYNHGLANVSDDGDAKHRVISVLATFEFPWSR